MKKNILFKSLFLSTTLLVTGFGLVGCNDDDDEVVVVERTASQILASTPWETTAAKNERGETVDLSNGNVINFVGYASFNDNAKFQMLNLDGSFKMQGNWSVSADGKTRTIDALNDQGAVLFSRVVDITVLNDKEFTYRIFPDAKDKKAYFDIIHTPVTQQVIASALLASTAWETTDAKNEQGYSVALSNPNVINYVGLAQFNIDGSFRMVNVDHTPKMQGNWRISADGKTRSIDALDDQGKLLFSRDVPMTVLNNKEFTYRTYPNANNKAIYFDIIHTPIDPF
ncbi:uncharacterized protein DUF4822 [Acinetobacter calcoaceticus]|uniref:Uncharacterized protein DUF4822 n=1 Tax=Acinetobacter calcoaceticus TaxID=471 RepID=A0A4R1Y0N9_ACICA|nr:uncharacterized protein DUF4822 [Acinetobacter calcoaceticus]